MSIINIPVVNEASEKLSTLWKQLWTLVIIWKVNDARTQIARDVFKSMEQTQEELEKLRQILVTKLTQESVDGVVSEAKAKAQVIIDIINRNLFERTADIWFLATDDDIRCYLCSTEAKTQLNNSFVVKRLLEYQAKYSVYENIYIFQPNGKFVLSAQQDNIGTISDAFLSECQNISSAQKYHEYYGEVSFSKENKLLYSYKITKDNTPDSEVIGVMVLSFDFQNEMKMIFENLEYGIPGSILCLLDENGKVISSNHNNVLQWRTYKKSLQNYEVISLPDGEYISYTTPTQWYQWFVWLPWYGHTMIPLKQAFKNEESVSSLDIHEVLSSKLVGDDLRWLINLVDKLNEDIKYMIINWHLIVSRQNSDYSNGMKPVFDEVVNISNGCKDVFSNSIGSMFNLIIQNLLNNIKSISTLGIDIMDRNLYERANDVRWWALTSKARIILARKEITPREKQILDEILTYIHSLYTVYDSLYIYDKNGKIVSASKLDSNGVPNMVNIHTLPNIWNESYIQNVFQNTSNGSQCYSVSEFEKTKLSQDHPTYIYTTGIKDEETSKTVGWIAIAFDSTIQFHNMLSEILPKNNWEVLPGSFALYTQRSGKIISTTNPMFWIGNIMEIPEIFLKVPNGKSYSDIVTIQWEKYIVWASCSKWYREFKTTDDYKNDVICIVCIRL